MTTTGTPEDAVASAIAVICSKLLAALKAGAPGAELCHLLDVAGQLLAVEDVTLLVDEDQLFTNDVPCHAATTVLLRDTMAGHGVRRLVFTRGTTARELLQLLALMVDPPQEATGAIASLWRAHGAWRIRLELAGEVSTRLIDPQAHGEIDQPLEEEGTGETMQQALAALWDACRADEGAAGSRGSADGVTAFASEITPARVRAVVRLVGCGVSFAPDQPLGVVLQRAGAAATEELMASLAAASGAVERRRYFDAIASLQHGVPELIGVLQHPTWYVARNAAALLGDLRAEAAGEALADLMAHDDPRVRLAAAESLAQLETDASWPALEAATRDPSPLVRCAAWSGLRKAPNAPPLPVLSDGLTNESDPVAQRALVACLAAHPLPMAIALLVRFCARLISNPRNEAIVCDALALLAEHRPGSIQPFVRRLQDTGGPATRTRLQALQPA